MGPDGRFRVWGTESRADVGLDHFRFVCMSVLVVHHIYDVRSCNDWIWILDNVFVRGCLAGLWRCNE